MHRSSVLFPDPLGPTTTSTSPRRTSSSTPRSTWKSPNHLLTRLSRRAGSIPYRAPGIGISHAAIAFLTDGGGTLARTLSQGQGRVPRDHTGGSARPGGLQGGVEEVPQRVPDQVDAEDRDQDR